MRPMPPARWPAYNLAIRSDCVGTGGGEAMRCLRPVQRWNPR
jgi:hypothetical protein